MGNGVKKLLRLLKKPSVFLSALVFLMLLQSCASELATSGVSTPKNAGKRIALVLGNNKYKEINSLKIPVNDATDIANALSSLGFEVILKTNANKSTLDTELKEFKQKSKGANVALFYFAGHGVQINGENILTPVDYNPLNQESGVSANSVQRIMQEATGGTKILILDACRDNPFDVRAAGKEGKGLAPMPALKEFIVMYSTAAGKTASDRKKGSRNSPYTAALLRHIKEPIPIETLLKRVVVTVGETTNPPQIPASYTSGLTGDFCFADCGIEIADTSKICTLKIGEGVYEGECKDGKAEGQGIQRYADGEYYKGSFQGNARNGKGTQYYTDGGEISGYWENGHLVIGK
jgi:hypothetical protein